MKALLVKNDMWQCANGDQVRPEAGDPESQEWVRNHAKARFQIVGSLSRTISDGKIPRDVFVCVLAGSLL